MEGEQAKDEEKRVEKEEEGEKEKDEKGSKEDWEVTHPGSIEVMVNIDKVLKTLERAFANDPVFEYLSSSPTNKAKVIAYFFRCFVTARPDLLRQLGNWKAVAHWSLMPQEDVGIVSIIKNGGLYSLWNSSKWYKTIKIIIEEDLKRSKYMADVKSYYYLHVLATDPDLQGKGCGSKFLNDLIGKADKAGLCCYLETSTEGARRLYERFGFVVLEEYRVSSDAPIIWLMRRNASGDKEENDKEAKKEEKGK